MITNLERGSVMATSSFTDKKVPAVAEAFTLLQPVLHRTFLGVEWATILKDVADARTAHVHRLRAELADRHPSILETCERIVAVAPTATLTALRTHHLRDAARDAKFLAARYVVWHPDLAYGDRKRPGRRAFGRSRLSVLNLLRSNDYGTFADFRVRPLETGFRCERCDRVGDLWIATPSGEGGFGFRCSHCSHADGYEHDGSRAWCPCDACRSERDAVRLRFQRDLWPAASAALEQHLAAQATADGHSGRLELPSELQMRRDWLMHRSGLTRAEAEVLEMQPATTDELPALVDRLNTIRRQQGRRRQIDLSVLFDRLVEHRVLYRVRVLAETPMEAPESWLAAYFGGNMECTARSSDGKSGGWRYGTLSPVLTREPVRILASGDDREFWRGLESGDSIQGTFICDRTTDAGSEEANPRDNWSIEWRASVWLLPEAVLRNAERWAPTFKEELHLNPFAVGTRSAGAAIRAAAVDRVVPEVRAQVLGSPAEQAVLSQLLARFPSHLVVPQLPLIAALRFDALTGYMAADALAYLKWSRVDFGIVDRENYELVRVVEVQAGAHHDTPDCERKDRWKREACALAGVAYEEVM